MTIEQAESLIRRTVQDNDVEMVRIIARVLCESNEAKQELRRKGYGHSGLGIVETVALVPEA